VPSVTLSFEEATAVVRRSPGSYDVELVPEYAVMGVKPNGGYMLACLGRAALDAAREAGSAHAHVVAAGAQYLASPDVGPARIDTEVLRVGRMATQVEVTLSSGDGVAVRAKFTLGTLPPADEPWWGGVAPVVLPPIDECEETRLSDANRGTTIAFDPATSVRFTPDGPVAKGEGEIRAWFRNDDQDQLDTLNLLYVADALPPATFGIVFNGWVPTLDITVYLRAIPAPGPLRLRFRAQMIQHGFADEICEGWDSAGRLVLQSTQLAALRLPPA
jgi:acyl-Coa thioesterase superfamily protein/acyl-CoA thioesterase superfamily protein